MFTSWSGKSPSSLPSLLSLSISSPTIWPHPSFSAPPLSYPFLSSFILSFHLLLPPSLSRAPLCPSPYPFPLFLFYFPPPSFSFRFFFVTFPSPFLPLLPLPSLLFFRLSLHFPTLISLSLIPSFLHLSFSIPSPSYPSYPPSNPSLTLSLPYLTLLLSLTYSPSYSFPAFISLSLSPSPFSVSYPALDTLR